VPVLHLLILAVVQGITEFLPISSSGHLVLTWEAFDALGWGQAGQTATDRLVLDVAVHVGTLAAVCVYFRRDIAAMLAGLVRWLRGRRDSGAQLAINVLVATLPVLVAGAGLRDRIEIFRDTTVIAATTIGFGLLLWLSDKMTDTRRQLTGMQVPDALLIGFLQILALIPGTSRAGITMTGARFLGYNRQDAARFSLLLSIPTILGAGLIAGAELHAKGNVALGIDAAIAAGFAAISAWIAIALMMRWLRTESFTPFVIYRLLLGGVLLVLVHAV
jgi:undecaprenyl-diphosphatase